MHHDDQLTKLCKKWAKIVAKAWADEDYKERFAMDPRSVCAEEGMLAGDDTDQKVLQDTNKVIQMFLPANKEDLPRCITDMLHL